MRQPNESVPLGSALGSNHRACDGPGQASVIEDAATPSIISFVDEWLENLSNVLAYEVTGVAVITAAASPVRAARRACLP